MLKNVQGRNAIKRLGTAVIIGCIITKRNDRLFETAEVFSSCQKRLCRRLLTRFWSPALKIETHFMNIPLVLHNGLSLTF